MDNLRLYIKNNYKTPLFAIIFKNSIFIIYYYNIYYINLFLKNIDSF